MKTSILRIVLLWSVLWLGAWSLLSAQETPRTLNFTKDQYQAYNQNWGISQLPNRLMFFGNNAGLLQFDGSTWRTTPLPNRQTIRAVATDKNGLIFTGGFEAMGYWKREKGSELSYHSLLPLLEEEPMRKEEIWHIVVTDNAVYFQSFSTIYRYNYTTIQRLSPPGAIMYLQKVHDRLLLPVIDRGIYEVQGSTFRLLKGSTLLAGKRVMCILPQAGHQFLIGTSNNGFFECNVNGQCTPWRGEVQSQLIANQLNKGILLSNGNLALGTILNGVYIVSRQGKILYHINQKNGLQNNTVLALHEDVAKNLWIGLDKGIDLVELSSPFTFFKDKNGSIGTVYAAALHQGNLYIGSNQGVFVKPWRGLQFADNQNDFQLVKGTQGQVWQLEVFDDQLLAGHNDGTFLLEGTRAERISHITGGWTTLRCPGKPNLLIQGTYTGLIALQKNGQGQWQFSHRIAGLRDPVVKILFDARGNVWIVNPYRGLYCIRLDADVQQITDVYSFKKSDGLPSEFKLDVEEFDNQIVIKSEDRFFYYNARENRFEPYERTDNPLLIPGDFRLKSGWQNDWFKIYRNHLSYINGNRQTDFNLALAPDFESIILLRKDLYLFGLDDGYALVRRADLEKATQVRATPEVIIHTAVASNRQKSRFWNAMNKIFLPPAANNLHFVFSQPMYHQTPMYSYLLEGYDTEWSAWQTLPEKEFTRLPPGSYTFKVRAKTASQPALFHFTIQPHWYQTGWAALLCLLLVGLIGWLVERWHQHRLKVHRKIMEEEKERQMEEHRIKTANERLQSDVIIKSKELANSAMNLIQKNEILAKIKEELQALRTSAEANLNGRHYQKITHLIDAHISSNHDWQIFEMNFNQVHEQFFKKLKIDFPELTPGDLKLAAYLKMNLSSKEIAPLLNISLRSLENKRYRLRRKLNLPEEVNLTEFMLQY